MMKVLSETISSEKRTNEHTSESMNETTNQEQQDTDQMEIEIMNQDDNMKNQDIRQITETMQTIRLEPLEQQQLYSRPSWTNSQNYKQSTEERNRAEYMEHLGRQRNYSSRSQTKKAVHFRNENNLERNNNYNERRYSEPCWYCLETGHSKGTCERYKKEFKGPLNQLLKEGRINAYNNMREENANLMKKHKAYVDEIKERNQEQYGNTRTETTRSQKRFKPTTPRCSWCETEIPRDQKMCKECNDWTIANRKLLNSRKEETEEETKKRTYQTWLIAGRDYCNVCQERSEDHHSHNHCKKCKKLSGNGPLKTDECECIEPYQEQEGTIEITEEQELNQESGWGQEPTNTENVWNNTEIITKEWSEDIQTLATITEELKDTTHCKYCKREKKVSENCCNYEYDQQTIEYNGIYERSNKIKQTASNPKGIGLPIILRLSLEECSYCRRYKRPGEIAHRPDNTTAMTECYECEENYIKSTLWHKFRNQATTTKTTQVQEPSRHIQILQKPMTYERHPQAIYTSRLMPFTETKDILQDSKQTSTPNNIKQVDMNQENSKRLHNIENINTELEEQAKELQNITKQQILSEEIYNEPDVISEASEEESRVFNTDQKGDRELLETVMTHNIELEYKKRELEETVERLKNLTRTVSYDTKRWDDTIIKILRQPNERREREDVIMIKARLREEFPNHDIDQTHEEMELIMRHRLGITNRRNFEAMILYAKREHKNKITRVRNENKILKDRIVELTNEDIEGRLKNQQEYNEDSGARRIYNLCIQLKELGEENEKLKERV